MLGHGVHVAQIVARFPLRVVRDWLLLPRDRGGHPAEDGPFRTIDG